MWCTSEGHCPERVWTCKQEPCALPGASSNTASTVWPSPASHTQQPSVSYRTSKSKCVGTALRTAHGMLWMNTPDKPYKLLANSTKKNRVLEIKKKERKPKKRQSGLFLDLVWEKLTLEGKPSAVQKKRWPGTLPVNGKAQDPSKKKTQLLVAFALS